jgi:hypothetical protein
MKKSWQKSRVRLVNLTAMDFPTFLVSRQSYYPHMHQNATSSSLMLSGVESGLCFLYFPLR